YLLDQGKEPWAVDEVVVGDGTGSRRWTVVGGSLPHVVMLSQPERGLRVRTGADAQAVRDNLSLRRLGRWSALRHMLMDGSGAKEAFSRAIQFLRDTVVFGVRVATRELYRSHRGATAEDAGAMQYDAWRLRLRWWWPA